MKEQKSVDTQHSHEGEKLHAGLKGFPRFWEEM